MNEKIKSITKEQVTDAIVSKLTKFYGVSREEASRNYFYKAATLVLRDIMLETRANVNKQNKESGVKTVYYLCMEFLIGKSLEYNLRNLGLYEVFYDALSDFGIELEEIFEEEPDAALGNGGLGRLAACYMDALTSCEYNAVGYTIMYEYGLFKQKIIDGEQLELPDIWLPDGSVWLVGHPSQSCLIRLGGNIRESWESGKLDIIYDNAEEIEAVPFDLMISGTNGDNINVLRLWKAKNTNNFDMALFSQGEYVRAIEKNSNAEVISKVLYPSDNHNEGKMLRLSQQYFLVSASIQDIIKRHLAKFGTLENFAEKNAIHINDTHPSLCIPELMRIFLDQYNYSWEDAWSVVCSCVSYTNHTILPEALEVWREELIKIRLPRIYTIIKEINDRFCKELWERYPGDWERISKMSILESGVVKMANLSLVASHKVNGVSALHSEILKNKVFPQFSELDENKFTNVTNGIAHRRWLCSANPNLSDFLDNLIGTGYRKNAMELEKLLPYQDDKSILSEIDSIKQKNKLRFSDFYLRNEKISISPDTVFDVQIKRMHEYKRQLLNALNIIWEYIYICNNPNADFVPTTHIFGAKAASNYYTAKDIIKLIWYLAKEIRENPLTRGKLSVVFCENYNVSLAEKLIPAAEISEQISLAGKEASGTGNMKMMMNGALTLGTLDGANVEIAEAVGRDNIYLFGLSADEVDELWKKQHGYKSHDFYQTSYKIREVIERLNKGFAKESFSNISEYLIHSGKIPDPYMCLADFESYSSKKNEMLKDYKDRSMWQKKSLVNIAKSGVFSADRSVEEYANRIWKLEKVTQNDSMSENL